MENEGKIYKEVPYGLYAEFLNNIVLFDEEGNRHIIRQNFNKYTKKTDIIIPNIKIADITYEKNN